MTTTRRHLSSGSATGESEEPADALLRADLRRGRVRLRTHAAPGHRQHRPPKPVRPPEFHQMSPIHPPSPRDRQVVGLPGHIIE